MRPTVLGLAAAIGSAALTLTSVPATSATSTERSAKAAARDVPHAEGHPHRRRPRHPVGRQADRRRSAADHRAQHQAPVPLGSGAPQATGRFPAASVWAGGETGLMGLAVDPKFRKNKRFYTCQGGHTAGGGHDVRVMAWRFAKRPARAVFVRRLLTGIPSTTGQHGGCRLLIASNGTMFVGTGDAATGTNPRNLNSLGGKTLRLNRFTGAPWKLNPYNSSANAQPSLRDVVRPPQRAGPGAAVRRQRVVGRARSRPRRRDQPPRRRRRLRLEPGPGLQRGRADDRPEPARQPGRRALALGLPHGRDLGHRLGPRRPVEGLPRLPGRGRAQGLEDDVHALRQERRTSSGCVRRRPSPASGGCAR